MSFREIKNTAKRVRKAMEFISGSTKLSGYCGRASLQLFRVLKLKNIKGIVLVDGLSHTFLLYKNKIIDITATQFGKKDRVYIKDIKDIKDYEYYYQITKKYTAIKKCWAYRSILYKSDKEIVDKYIEI
jgi:hypothetical protein